MALSKQEMEENREMSKSVLVNSYKMQEKSIEEMLKRRKEIKDKDGNPIYSEKDTQKTLQLMQNMLKDTVDRYIALGGTEEELKAAAKIKSRKMDKNALENLNKSRDEMKAEMQKYIENMKGLKFKETLEKQAENEKFEQQSQQPVNEDEIPTIYVPQASENELVIDESDYQQPKFEIPEDKKNVGGFNNFGNRIQWDNVPLPSLGECYKSKFDKVPVAYLTAYDENLIVSPNLYKDGTFLDELVKSKIMNSNIKLDDLLPGDRDAIILWLRGTSYGPDFPVTATDNESGKQFDTTVDLTMIKAKPFKLKGDENGYFDFELPVSKDKIKFRFLTYGDLKRLEMIDKEEQVGIKKRRMNEILSELREFVDADEDCERQLKRNLNVGLENFNKYVDFIEEDEKSFSHIITNKLILSIVSVNGVDNRNYINEYVSYMNVRDSSALRKYITENEPGLDFNVEVERPESLGGGSVRMFLTFDQFIFLNIA